MKTVLILISIMMLSACSTEPPKRQNRTKQPRIVQAKSSADIFPNIENDDGTRYVYLEVFRSEILKDIKNGGGEYLENYLSMLGTSERQTHQIIHRLKGQEKRLSQLDKIEQFDQAIIGLMKI